MLGFNEGRDVSPFGICAREAMVGVPCVPVWDQYDRFSLILLAVSEIPFVPLRYHFWIATIWSSRKTFNVTLCALLVETVEFEAVCGRRSCGAGPGDPLDGIERVYKDSVCSLQDGVSMSRGNLES